MKHLFPVGEKLNIVYSLFASEYAKSSKAQPQTLEIRDPQIMQLVSIFKHSLVKSIIQNCKLLHKTRLEAIDLVLIFT